ncbi:glycoside hydrolase family 5 protein [Neolentinus lepideus HHB14362 ss-1]|uniref:Glycoside hydrolase family 5 protein n=1 Tax=Neolentinus lepideus HHB14362 ss-1 TaxID=1314782 RepID=A0A165T820_9AGAM|nr:glycoside hydrolase family 5 protein [Neolentinus lepideus HHB14362 ss-1]
MLFSQTAFASLLQSLGLAKGLFKPFPGETRTFQNPSVLSSHSSDVLENLGVCEVQPYAAPNLTDRSAPFDPVKSTIYRYRQQQSVNLGSWFVHEQWLTPSTFKCSSGKQISEWDIATGWGSPAAARSLLEKHWDSFITQEDFDYLASVGINTVRVPIGYWNLGPTFCQGTPFEEVADVYANSWSRVKQAINFADRAGLGVLVDLHGAPGSQNGQPHSGVSDGQTNLFDDPSNVEKTMQVLTFLMTELDQVTNIAGIQILNEPKNVVGLEDFYTEAISRMRQVSPQAVRFPLYIHDGFDLDRFSRYVANRSDFVVQDHHSYFVFSSPDIAESASQHAADVQSSILTDLQNAAVVSHRNLVVDEWSCALAPQSLAQESDKSGAQQRFCADQAMIYSDVIAGWSFWAYMKEDCDTDPGWCFRSAVGKYLPTVFSSFPGTAFPLDAQGTEQTFLVPLQNVSGRRDISGSTQFVINKGYSDGFQTAVIFASYGMSRLGFVEQYIQDSLSTLVPVQVAPAEEDIYRQWFRLGLRDGEASVNGGI